MNKPDMWQQHIRTWEESGLSQTEFCRQHTIALHNFQYWRKRLAPSTQKSTSLIPINVTRTATARLLLGSQVTIELPAEQLPDLLLALRDRGLLHASA